MSASAKIAARDRMIQAVLHILSAERSEPHAHSDADAEYAEWELDAAARAFVQAEAEEGAS